VPVKRKRPEPHGKTLVGHKMLDRPNKREQYGAQKGEVNMNSDITVENTTEKALGGSLVFVGARVLQVGVVDPEPTSKIVLVITGGLLCVVGALVASA